MAKLSYRAIEEVHTEYGGTQYGKTSMLGDDVKSLKGSVKPNMADAGNDAMSDQMTVSELWKKKHANFGEDVVRNYFAYHLIDPAPEEYVKLRTKGGHIYFKRYNRALVKAIVDSYQVWNMILSYLSPNEKQRMCMMNKDLYARTKDHLSWEV
jgi:hypothetical protein